MNEYKQSARMGWSKKEDALLFECVRQARSMGEPLKTVFDEVAQKTGRKPNSIRNYYYARVKEGPGNGLDFPHNPAFTPFSKEEIDELLTTVLGAQARGISVRACTLQMGDGDNRAMLRYQNKYRSLLKSNQQLVKEVVQRMRENGEPAFDPYAGSGTVKRAGRPRKSTASLLEIVGDVVEQLDRVEGLDVSLFFESLGALAVAASKGAQAINTLRDMNDNEDVSILVEENADLKARLSEQNAQLEAQRERFTILLGYFRRLIDVNREFLHLTSVTKVSSLSTYIRELSRNVANCEKWIVDDVR